MTRHTVIASRWLPGAPHMLMDGGEVIARGCKEKLEHLALILNAGEDDEWDATDAAHPAWWRGEQSGVHGACEKIESVLSGKDHVGVCREPLQGVLELAQGIRVERDRADARMREVIAEGLARDQQLNEARQRIESLEAALYNAEYHDTP